MRRLSLIHQFPGEIIVFPLLLFKETKPVQCQFYPKEYPITHKQYKQLLQTPQSKIKNSKLKIEAVHQTSLTKVQASRLAMANSRNASTPAG